MSCKDGIMFYLDSVLFILVKSKKRSWFSTVFSGCARWTTSGDGPAHSYLPGVGVTVIKKAVPPG